MSVKEARQKTFDEVAKHLLTQNRRATSDISAGCAYRAEDGLKCAIGCLIPDELYISGMEGKSPYNDGVFNSLPKYAQESGKMFLYALQRVHDSALPLVWPARLRDFANRWGLSPAVVDKTLQERVHA